MTAETDINNQLPLVSLKPDKLQIVLAGVDSEVLKKLEYILAETPNANVSVVTPSVNDALRRFVTAYPGVKIIQRSFSEKDLEIGKTEQKKSAPLEAGKKWSRIATYSLVVFAIMLTGHLIFSYIPFRAIFEGTVNLSKTFDKSFPIMLLAGFLAQLVDGALGMGYGVTSSSILLSAGVNPAAISGSIHTAEMFASGASGYSHYKFGNVNIKLFRALLLPGVLGAVGGAILLVFAGEKYGAVIRPVIAIYTLLLGVRFIMNAFREAKPQKKFSRYKALAGIGGFFDSFAGGGWGPIVTSTLINSGRSHRYVIGSVSLTEFFVTLSSAFTFFTLIGVSHWQTILGLIAGGFIAAPIAAKLTGKLPRKVSYALLGILVIIWSIRILIKLL